MNAYLPVTISDISESHIIPQKMSGQERGALKGAPRQSGIKASGETVLHEKVKERIVGVMGRRAYGEMTEDVCDNILWSSGDKTLSDAIRKAANHSGFLLHDEQGVSFSHF
jgi:hypothetical protein